MATITPLTYYSVACHSPTIHTLGNSGFRGAVHAALAPITTKMIDVLAYEGIDVRQQVCAAEPRD